MSQQPKVKRIETDICENGALVQWFSGRYGALALTRAAQRAAEAERKGDGKEMALWKGVVRDLRHNVLIADSVV